MVKPMLAARWESRATRQLSGSRYERPSEERADSRAQAAAKDSPAIEAGNGKNSAAVRRGGGSSSPVAPSLGKAERRIELRRSLKFARGSWGWRDPLR